MDVVSIAIADAKAKKLALGGAVPIPGPQGAPGPKGDKGDQGTPGIDGKPIYRCVFTGTITQPANGVGYTSLFSGVAKLVNYGGSWNVDGIWDYTINGTNMNGNSSYLQKSNTGQVVLITISTTARTNAPYDVWLEYTKV